MLSLPSPQRQVWTNSHIPLFPQALSPSLGPHSQPKTRPERKGQGTVYFDGPRTYACAQVQPSGVTCHDAVTMLSLQYFVRQNA
jgi:hypothetical protein